MKKDEFDRLVQDHQALIWKVCRAFAHSKEDQKDLFQEILYTLWKGRNSFSGDSKISTWIYRVSFNRAIDHSRKRKMPTTEFKETAMPGSDHQEGDYDIEALYLAIRKLAPVDRAIIIMYLEKYSYKEIGETMGLTEKNVSVKLVRIKEKLKEHYLELTKTPKS